MAENSRPKMWIVQAPCELRHVLMRMGVSGGALADGRVFVEHARCKQLDMRLEAGDCVDVYPASVPPAGDVVVLARRGDLIAVHKPAGLSTIPDQRGNAASLLDVVARIVGERDRTRVHPTSRLDRQVSGVVVFALGREARALMQQARESGSYRRHYVAIAMQPPHPTSGWVDVPIGRGRSAMERKAKGRKAVPAKTRYESVATAGSLCIISAEPKTGRTHQIRVHLAHVGAPLVGDVRYGAANKLVLPSGAVVRPGRIALHAAWVEVVLRKSSTPWRLSADVPEALRTLWERAGGDSDAWERALAPLD